MLYIGWEESGEVADGAPGPWDDLTVLRPGLVLIDSEATRSEVYHALKRLSPVTGPVIVAPLSGEPKMSRTAPGTTTWVRDRRRPTGGGPGPR